MSDCCENHTSDTEKKKGLSISEKPPKPFIGKYLYNLGKKDLEKEKQSGKHKGGCC